MPTAANAGTAKMVKHPLDTPGDRHSIHHDPQYYRIRNHLVDFLVNRSKLYQSGETLRPAQPPLVRPGADGNADGNARPASAPKIVTLIHCASRAGNGTQPIVSAL